MEVRCMHFAEEYRLGPRNKADLLGMFNTLSWPRLPQRYDFVVYVEVEWSPEDRRFRNPLRLTMKGPNDETAISVTDHAEPFSGRNVHAPFTWWVVPVTAVFSAAGYYHFAVIADDIEVGAAKLLVASGIGSA